MEVGGLEFDWDEGNRAKRQKHGLSSHDIESLFQRPLSVFPDAEHSKDEERFIGMGKQNRTAAFLLSSL
jgi:uncharacterized protein